jgi:hypothetical protein
MKKAFAVVLALVLVSQPLFADENPGKPGKEKSSATAVSETVSADAAKPPIRRVVLYKNGVGYFEHPGRVRGSQNVHIDFTSAQLNDVLKSTQLAALRKNIQDTEIQRDAAQTQLETMIDELHLEASF